MVACLLCLENNNKMANSIRVDSLQWKKENINYLIEKYLWPMDTTQQSSWLCSACWQEIYDFHRFYSRIEEAQLKSGAGDETLPNGQLQKNCMKSLKVKETFIKTNNCIQVDSDIKEYYDQEILLEEPLPADFVIESKHICLKEEQQNEEEICSKNIIKNQISKNELSEKSSVNKNEIYTKDPLKSINSDKEKIFKLEANVSECRSDEESNSDSEIHSDFQRIKKKRKNPDEKTGKEYDQFISENFQIVCSFCHVFQENFITLRKHFREEHNKRGFVICCKKKIFSRPLLVDHIHVHLDPNYFKCKQCDKIYSDRSTLESHIKLHGSNQLCRNHTCDKCGKNFVGSTQLENHKKVHEPGYEKQFSCGECNKLFTTSYSLNYHIQAIHQNKCVNICDICGKTMRCRNQFKLHMEKHNSKESMSMNCEICGLRLTDRRGLRRHKNSQHPVGGKKEYSCHLCSKVSHNRESLNTHVRLTHSKNNNHKCTMCDKTFKRTNALKEHMATHTGIALYTCPWCPKTFISNGNMHNHRKKAHPLEWEEAHQKKFASNLLSNQNLV